MENRSELTPIFNVPGNLFYFLEQVSFMHKSPFFSVLCINLNDTPGRGFCTSFVEEILKPLVSPNGES